MERANHSQSHKQENRAAAGPQHEEQSSEGLSLLPPSIQLKASNGDAPESPEDTSTNVLQRETKSLPETLGPTQEGPIAARAPNDDHAFSPNDIRQGSIGDCYFLASLGAVANTNPQLLRDAITENSDGTYTVKLYTEQETGWWIFSSTSLQPHYVTIYPTFPIAAGTVDSANPDPSDSAHAWSAPGDENELWVRLIEKAYALLIGSYTQIGAGGLTADAMETLTGEQFTERVIANDSNENVKERILEMVEDNIPVTVSCTDLSSLSPELQQFANENSIVSPHAYTVIRANESTIRVRNPWGQGDPENDIGGARNAEPVMTWDQFFGLFDQFSDKD